MKITHSYSDITDWFFETLASVIEKQGSVTVGLGGGSSFDEWYSSLIQSARFKEQNVENLFNRILWCVTDERVNCDIPDRNDAHIWEIFLGPLFEKYEIPEENFIRPDIDDDGERYTEKILLVGSPPLVPNSNPHPNPPPMEEGVVSNSPLLRRGVRGEVSGRQVANPSTSLIDIAFFGMGPDGHAASLFPHHPALESEEEGFIKIDNAPKFPPERISLSPKSIQSLEHVCLFAVGESKKEAFANFLDDTVSIDYCPVKLLRPEIVFDGTR